jgi:hypothetical protein
MLLPLFRRIVKEYIHYNSKVTNAWWRYSGVVVGTHIVTDRDTY